MSTAPQRSNTIEIQGLHDPHLASWLNRKIFDLRRLGYEEIDLDLSSAESCFPNSIVPIAAIIDRLRQDGLRVEVRNPPKKFHHWHIADPLLAAEANVAAETQALSRLWRFEDGDHVHHLALALRKEFELKILCGRDVMQAMHWSLVEVMDNVLNHSQAGCGFLMAQVHPNSNPPRLVVCVADQGIGVLSSLKPTYPHLKNDADAIALAMKQGVTRDRRIGQGNGLWGLARIVGLNRGTLRFSSGRNSLSYSPQVDREKRVSYELLNFYSKEMPGTCIDFQLEAANELDLSQALELPIVIDHHLESRETESGEHLISVLNEAYGTGTRESGRALRTQILNLRTAGASVVSVDFDGVGILSSSFADEALGKLAAEIGFVQFNQQVRLTGLSPFLQGVVNRSVLQRLAYTGGEGPEPAD